MNQQMEAAIDDTKKKTIPAIVANTRMKKVICDLFTKLGFTRPDAWFNTYLETNDLDGLVAHMKQPHIVKQFLANQEKRQRDQDQVGQNEGDAQI